MNINHIIANELSVKLWQVDAAIKLIDEGNTIPFIARYRKPVTGELNDEQLRTLDERLKYLRNLEEKKKTVVDSITEQGKMTDEIMSKIAMAETIVAVDDIYRPFRPKRKTRATEAKAKGLEPLADIFLKQEKNKDPEEEAKAFVNEEKGVANVAEAIQGAKDIIAEIVSDNDEFRKAIRNTVVKHGLIVSNTKNPEEKTPYENYYDYSEGVNKIPGHRILAINRGEKEKVLNVKIEMPEENIIASLDKVIIKGESQFKPLLKEAIEDGFKRLIKPAIEREIRSQLTEKAEDGAITVFGQNLKQLLMQPPIAGRNVLGWDPAFRTGCKLAVVDNTGKVLYTTVIFPTAPQNKVAESKKIVLDIIKKYNVSLISLGNGTASRESEAVIVDIIKECPTKVEYIIVNEAGASVYSASKLATEEFPNFDVGQRSATSMARRLQDPLAELVKIEPKAIGVGQYQHDMNQKKLDEALSNIVEDCVNNVGVDLNTASAPLLEYVSGISKTIAKNIVEYREENGQFQSRKDLLSVAKLGPKAFEQCAGFMRIREGKEPLDYTSVHPESYSSAKKLLKKYGFSTKDILGGNIHLTDEIKDVKEVAEEIGTDPITLRDMIKELEKPGRDPREEMPKPVLKSDVLDFDDLKEGMELKGTVRNVIDFGAFVDIGVHQDGLVHISEMSNKFIKHPLDVVSVGDVVDVRVLSVDKERKRIQLSMKK
ncbi:RNA-binding transcriptional accessory protein [Eubacterium ventriosum]|uniref:RNA-binding transcriptional accessory protein n=2 Tax=Eubacterium ventriosum TaxID=39496 RepID=A0A414R984_9FIRM|nr:Tex family protein [Eubacterium ventriosum]MCQ5339292.1 RNA-binding transcriptional accessory protein [Eubacterium ventriosum]RHA20040.1 RNA-binding transcriptional accessory protein [Eubacterium ventriosum]RHB17826.1 RNA-binding transcriptional accessory protein [Eubacterium ventriosum]RHF89614.1 RNA-binding transcriptional accessory protein [Eubacterium ventriosum]